MEQQLIDVMEQQLIDVLEKAEKPEDIDEVSRAMITARVTDALEQVRKATKQYIESLSDIQKEHAFELKLGGLTVVLNVTDDLVNVVCKEPVQMCIVGNRNKVLDNIKQIMEQV